jgi:hypothetical protein
MRTPHLILILLVAGLCAATAIAPSPCSANNIAACAKRKGGALRIGSDCKKTESPITLNAEAGPVGCSLLDMAGADGNGVNKMWLSTAAEVTYGQALYNCSFSPDAAGNVPPVHNGCGDTYIGDESFDHPDKYNITSGRVSYLGNCTYNIVLNLDDGTVQVIAHGILTPDRMTFVGNFLVNWGGGGPFSAVRIK